MFSNLDIIWYIQTTPELLISLTLKKFFINLFSSKIFVPPIWSSGLLHFLQE